MPRQQLQWRTSDSEEWRYHSNLDAEAARQQIAAYHTARPDGIFCYRLVELDSPEAIAAPAPALPFTNQQTSCFQNT